MKNLKKALTLIIMSLLFITVFSSCNEKIEEVHETETVVEDEFNLVTAKKEIVAANAEFKAYFASSDSIGLGNLYTEDTKFMMTGAPAITGRASVVSTFSAIMKSGITSVNLKTVEVCGNNEFITEEGEYSLYAGETQADYGKYLVLWKNEEGKWKLHRDIFNTNASAE